MLLYGKNSVLQRLLRNPMSITKIYLDEDFNDSAMLDIIKKNKVPVNRLSKKEFKKVKRSDCLQGIIAEVGKFSYAPIKDLLNNKELSLIFLDSVSDPQNLGSIIRTSACFGGFAIVIPKHDSCEINETVLRVACGGENFILISMVTNFSTALIEAKKSGFWVAGAVVERGDDLGKIKLPFPLCLVLGSEGEGIRHGLQNHLDLKISLPMSGASLSFNVSVACAIFCHEIFKQKPK